jgi:hypothetical protein
MIIHVTDGALHADRKWYMLPVTSFQLPVTGSQLPGFH